MKLRAWIEVEITGAAPERCLNRFSRKDVGFWCLNVDGPFRLTCRLLAADWPRAEREITAALCACKVLKRGGLVYALSGLRRRPVLVIGVCLAWALAFLAQYFVWFVRVEPSDQISAERIRQALSEEGVRFGVWGPGLDTQWFKNRMLNRIPELRWLGVHTEGGIAVVDYSVRDEPIRQGTPLTEPANVVAARDGIVTSLSVHSGLAVVEPGTAVRAGELLVSGVIDCPTHTQITRAAADVEALTEHRFQVKMPLAASKKVYTGRTETVRTLIFQKYRRNISGNSSIFGMTCDKMIETDDLTLPGGWTLPMTLETVTLREYRLTPAEISEQAAAAVLGPTAEDLVCAELTAGTVTSRTLTITRTDTGYEAGADFGCREIISRADPIDPFGEEASHGQNHQRRAHGTDHQRVRFLR